MDPDTYLGTQSQSSAAYQDKTEPAPPTGMGDHLDALDSLIGEVRETFARLVQRISPVLLPEYDNPQKSDDARAMPRSSPTSARLIEQAERMRVLLIEMRDTLDRVNA